MNEKRVKYNECYISGEVVDFNHSYSNIDTSEESLRYELRIEVAPGQIVSVENYVNRYDDETAYVNEEDSAKYKAAMTVLQGIDTKVKTGKGTLVNCTSQLQTNWYHYSGRLVEDYRVKVQYCNREKDSKYPIKPGSLWKLHVLIDSIEEREGKNGKFLYVKAFTLEYSSPNSTKGGYLSFRITDPDMIEGFKNMYTIGSIGELEGTFKEDIFIEEPARKGFGSKVKPRRRVERYLEVEGGEEPINTKFDKNTRNLELVNIDDLDHPLHTKIEDVREKADEKLQKSKAKDDLKMANTKKVDDNDLPF